MVTIEAFELYNIKGRFFSEKMLKVKGMTLDGHIKFSVYFRYHPEKEETISYYLGNECPAELTFLEKEKIVEGIQLKRTYIMIYEMVYRFVNNGYPIILKQNETQLHA